METETVKLSLEQKEEFIDKLLTYMKDDVEKIGCKISQARFNFMITKLHSNYAYMDGKDGEDYKRYKQQYGLSDEVIDLIIKSCIANEYIEGRIYDLELTRQGWARANSVEKAKLYKPSETSSNYTFHGTVNLNNSQIGNNNKQEIRIENDIENLIKFIETIQAPKQEKTEAKNILLDFLKHPLITSVLGTTVNSIIKTHFGG